MSRYSTENKRRNKIPGKSKYSSILLLILVFIGLSILIYVGFQMFMVSYTQAHLRNIYDASAGFINNDRPDETVIINGWQPMRLVIPAINLDLICLGGGDVFDRKLLDKGPVHFQMSDLPSTEGGNVSFAAHRAGKWNFFLDLDLLKEGDQIYLDVSNEYRFIYQVEWVRVFHETEWSPLIRDANRLADYFGHTNFAWRQFDEQDYPAITLQTCHPKHVAGTDQRLIVRGVLQKVVHIPDESSI